MPEPRPIISLRNVGVRYRPKQNIFNKIKKEVWALRGLNLDVMEGENLGILGRNGCGKSTLMRLLAGVFEQDEGTLVFGKKDPHVQLLAVAVGFEGNLNGEENAVLNGMLMGKSAKHMRSRIASIREFSGLGDFFDMPVNTYSSGMALRLGFSVAMETDPDVLLIDEVLGVGDAVFLEKSRRAIREKFMGDRTVILISHDPKIIASICTRAVWLEKGQILAEGDPEEVAAKYHAGARAYTS